jgi:flagellar protein FlaI
MLMSFRLKLKKKLSDVKYERFVLREPKHLIVIPRVTDPTKLNVRYNLLYPFAKANVKWDRDKKSIVYRVIEPKLDEREAKIKYAIEQALEEIIDVKLSVIKNESGATNYLEKKVMSVIQDLGIKVPEDSYQKIMYYIVRDFVGLNEIEAMMHDPYIEDIGCNGLNTPVYIIHRRFGSIETSVVYKNPERLSDFVVKMAERCGRYISYAVPLLDGSLPDGSRVQASLARDVTTRGPTFSIRRFRRNPYSPVDLINLGTVSVDIMAYLWILVQYNVSMLICGGVSTGKTTFLNCMSMFIEPEEKIISIEDTREINLPHENWIPSVSRTGFGTPLASGKRYGEVDLFDLLKESFRQNPSYVIVGEVRGKEAYVLFQGMASGHSSIGTIHAGSVDDVIKRLQTPPIELSPSLIESLDVMIVLTHSKEKGPSARRVKEVVEVQSLDERSGRAYTKEIFSWVPSSDSFRETLRESELLRVISFQEGFGYQRILQELEERKAVLKWMVEHDIREFDDVCKLINTFYNDKETIMEWVRKNQPPPHMKKADKLWKKSQKAKKEPKKLKPRKKTESKKEEPKKPETKPAQEKPETKQEKKEEPKPEKKEEKPAPKKEEPKPAQEKKEEPEEKPAEEKKKEAPPEEKPKKEPAETGEHAKEEPDDDDEYDKATEELRRMLRES